MSEEPTGQPPLLPREATAPTPQPRPAPAPPGSPADGPGPHEGHKPHAAGRAFSQQLATGFWQKDTVSREPARPQEHRVRERALGRSRLWDPPLLTVCPWVTGGGRTREPLTLLPPAQLQSLLTGTTGKLSPHSSHPCSFCIRAGGWGRPPGRPLLGSGRRGPSDSISTAPAVVRGSPRPLDSENSKDHSGMRSRTPSIPPPAPHPALCAALRGDTQSSPEGPKWRASLPPLPAPGCSGTGAPVGAQVAHTTQQMRLPCVDALLPRRIAASGRRGKIGVSEPNGLLFILEMKPLTPSPSLTVVASFF